MPINRYLRFDFQNPIPERTFSFPDDLPYTIEGDRDSMAHVLDDGRTVEVAHNNRVSLHWRGWVGTFIKDNLNAPLNKPWHLSEFPKGWKLVQRKGIKDPNRLDAYLYGYKGAKQFRSPQEFAFHAVWLFHADYHSNHHCECRLCTSRDQLAIEQIWWGIPGMPIPNAEDAPAPVEGGYPPRRPDGPRIARPTYAPTRYPLLHASVIDAKSRYTKDLPADMVHDLQLTRLFRPNEVVWVSIHPIVPSNLSAPPDLHINFWPAIVWRPAKGADLRDYKVQFLHTTGYAHTEARFEDIIPWRAYRLSRQIEEMIQNIPLQGQSVAELSRFRPSPSSSSSMTSGADQTFEAGLADLALAVGKARWLEERYTLTHWWIDFDRQTGPIKAYQSVLWGAEQIWVDDIVRLVTTREQLVELLRAGSYQANLRGETPGALGRLALARIKSITWSQAHEEARFYAEIFELEDLQLSLEDAEQEVAADYPCPNPPAGYRLRRITEINDPVPLPLSFISGRLDTLGTEAQSHQRLFADVTTSENLKCLYVAEATGDLDNLEDERLERLRDLLALSGLCTETAGRPSPRVKVDSNHQRKDLLSQADKETKAAMVRRSEPRRY